MSDREYFDAVAEAMLAGFGALMPGWFLIKPPYRALVVEAHAAGASPEATAAELARLTARPQQAAA